MGDRVGSSPTVRTKKREDYLIFSFLFLVKNKYVQNVILDYFLFCDISLKYPLLAEAYLEYSHVLFSCIFLSLTRK